MTDVTVIILTRDEALHIARAIASVRDIANRVLVVDSGGTDGTVEIARAAGADVVYNAWVNSAVQFNWALDQLGPETDWVLRLDADEYVTPDLAAQIKAGLPDVAGITIGRSMRFQGVPIRFGGLFPIRILRLFRAGRGRCEDRWMDEHIVVDGPVAHLSGQIIDDNRKPLDWWIAKHNSYANREVIDILNQRFGFLPRDPKGGATKGRAAAFKRVIKEQGYGRVPLGLRAGIYFLYRYVVRFGFLDRREARAFHVLQGFWYRYLVDAKLAEVERYMADTRATPVDAIRAVLAVDVAPLAQEKAPVAA